MTSFRFLSGLLLTIALASSAGTAFSQTDTASSSGAILKNIVAPDLLAYAKIEATGTTAYKFGKDVYGDYIQLNASPDQIVKYGATGSEIAINFPFQEGDTVRYSWRMSIPAREFNSDAPMNRWWLFARWNDQANPKLGENPEEFLIYNPVMMFGYKQVSGRDLLNFTYGVPESLNAGSFGMQRDQWIKFTVEVTWSRKDQGRVKVYVNDAKLPEREVSGPNMHRKYQNIFRLGISRSSEINTIAGIRIGDVRVERVKK